MIRIEQSTVIRKKPAEVFGFISDISNLPRWQAGAIKSEMVGDSPLATGSRFREVVRVGPLKLDTECVVTELRDSEVFAFEAMSSPIDYAGSFRFTQEADGTRVSLRAVAQMKGVWRLLEPLLAGDLHKESRVELENLRRVLEAGQPV
ncbi:MAG TPA: SRPBCC family protein [Dehalococcoidia bacterium]|nr:SRPBCC family protein [Dehalococcoidia bacterium]